MPFLGKSPTAGFASIVKDDLTGNGTTGPYTLSKQVANANDIAVFVGNVRQEPTDAYTVNGNQLTMTGTVSSSQNFYVLHIAGTHESSVIPADGTISTAKLQSSAVTTAKITNANITQAKLASGVVGNGPSFSAYLNANFTLSSATHTKLQFETEEWDTASCYDTSTYRFTPNVAGYYMVGGHFQPQATYTTGTTSLYKNGVAYRYLHWNQHASSVTSPAPVGGQTLVYMNGTSDYVELYGYLTTGQIVQAGSAWSWFQGHMVRSA